MSTYPYEHALETIAEPRPDTRAYDLYRKMLAEIRDGLLEPGKKLKSNDLIAVYKVSTGPLREALARLSAEGFVLAEGKKGFRVRDVSQKDFKEITELRGCLEVKGLRDAMVLGDEDWEDRVVLALRRLKRYSADNLRTREKLDEREFHHRVFHHELLSGCGSSWLLNYYSQLSSHAERYRRLVARDNLQDSDYVEHTDIQHERIVKYVLARDTENALKVLDEHRAKSFEAISAQLRAAASASPAGGEMRKS